MFSVEHGSSRGPAVMEEGKGAEGGGGATRFLFSKQQAVEFPQVLAIIM